LSAKTCILASVITAHLLLAVGHGQTAPLFHFTEKRGPYPVGLRVVAQYDYSRIYHSLTDDLGKPYQGERARPLQTLIWYPAKKSTGKAMTVGDYGNLMASETSFEKPRLNHDAQDWIKGMTPTLAMPLWAVRDAPQEPGRFPLVVYAPSFSAMSWENADLCEYLASHGYVVVASPDMGETNRSMTGDLTGINAQTRDISFLIGYAQTLSNVDISKVAVAGFSWGGISNLFAAARDSRIDALVAFDGSMRYFPGLVKQAGDVHPEAMTIPLLFFSQGDMSIEDQARFLNDKSKNDGPSVLNAWTHGDLIMVHMLGLTHTEFSSMYQRNEDIWKEFPHAQKADYSREDGIPGYAWAARYTVHFLDAYLKHDAASMAYLKKTPAENGAPPHFIAVNFRPGKGLPASMEAFRAELGCRGFDHASEIYAAMQKDNPDFKLDKTTLTAWGDDLISDNALPEAISLLKFEVQIYPDTSSGHASLAEAYMKSGQKQLAIENYKKALEINPENNDAKEKVKELESTPPPKN
jgi:tetratricopeptide (TPR) repeat protein